MVLTHEMGFESLNKTKPKAKAKHRKGLWSPEEDERLRNYIIQHGHGCWTSVPINAGLRRNGKSCRLRWINYLRPGLKRGMFSTEEEETILHLHHALGNKWSQIAQHLPGRTDNEVKNFWHSYLKKKVARDEEIESISKIQITNSNSTPLEIESPVKSIDTISSLDPFEKESDLDRPGDNQTYLPKLFFAEWLTLDNINSGQNNIQANQFPCYNLDLQEGFTQDVIYNQLGDDTLDSQLTYEDQTAENGFGELSCQDHEIPSNIFHEW